MTPRIIITGGTGLIGRALSRELISTGYEVIVLSRTPNTVKGLPAGVRVEGWDGRTGIGWGGLVNGARAIVNLAGANLAGEGFIPSRWTPERKRLIVESRLNAGRAVVDAVRMAILKPWAVLQASGVGYYGPRGDEPVGEDQSAGDDFLAQLAVQWEASTAEVTTLGVRQHICLRTGIVLSREGGALSRMVLQHLLYVGGPFGNGKQWFPWIHPADEVAAIRFLIENTAANGPFNLVAPNPLTMAEFSRALGRVLRRPSWLPVPAVALRLFFGEAAQMLLTGQRAVPQRLTELGFQFRFPHAEDALRDLLQRDRGKG